MKSLMIIIVALVTLGGCSHYGPVNTELQTQLNLERTNEQICSEFMWYIESGNEKGTNLMHTEIKRRGFLTKYETDGLVHGYVGTGYTGFNWKAMRCRFVMATESERHGPMGQWMWYRVYSTATNVKRVLTLNGVVQATY